MTHVDDFTIAGNDNFLEDVKKGILDILTISKVEKDKFRFNGLAIEKYENHIKVMMKDYANSLKEISGIRKADRIEMSTKLEMKE